MPVTPDSDHLTLKQYIDRGLQAADLIEQLQARIAEQQKEIESLWETHIKVADTLGIVTEQTRKTKGKPSAVYLSYINGLQQEHDELAATVERLRDALQNYTAEQVCCGQGEIQYSSEGEPIGQECCGKPDIDWPEDVVELLSTTPRQNLNAIKQESYREGYSDGWKHSLGTKADDGNHYACGERLAVQLANQRYPDKE